MKLEIDKPLACMRLLVCGKGGSGKSSFVTLMARILANKGYQVLALDGDASNPGGLARLLMGQEQGPEPLIDYFGGRQCVTCPVDDPSPLTRKGERTAVTEDPISVNDVSAKHLSSAGNITLVQTGKIRGAYEGCDGPMSKVTRDFVVQGEAVTLIDVEAGIEHFGRGIAQNVDAVIAIVDPTFESFSVSQRICDLCRQMEIPKVWAILNKVESDEMRIKMVNALERRKVGILGTVRFDPVVAQAGFDGSSLETCPAMDDIRGITDHLENVVTQDRVATGIAL